MKSRKRLINIAILILCIITASVATALAQHGFQRDPLAFLKRAITAANAPTLTTTEETQITTLITAFHNALPDEPDAIIEAARTAFDNAIIAGDLTAAKAQATIIANRTAVLVNTRLQAEATFKIGVLAVLKAGGQFNPLVTKFGNDRLLDILDSLTGHGLSHGPGHGSR